MDYELSKVMVKVIECNDRLLVVRWIDIVSGRVGNYEGFIGHFGWKYGSRWAGEERLIGWNGNSQ